jgi:hypothetical protein
MEFLGVRGAPVISGSLRELEVVKGRAPGNMVGFRGSPSGSAAWRQLRFWRCWCGSGRLALDKAEGEAKGGVVHGSRDDDVPRGGKGGKGHGGRSL